jgi:hypothetical protein
MAQYIILLGNYTYLKTGLINKSVFDYDNVYVFCCDNDNQISGHHSHNPLAKEEIGVTITLHHFCNHKNIYEIIY